MSATNATEAAAACRAWILTALPAITKVYYDQQIAAADFPRPKSTEWPYATIHFDSGAAASDTPYVAYTDTELVPGPPANEFEKIVYQRMEGELNVQIFGDDAFTLCDQLIASKHRQTEMVQLHDAGIAVRRLSDTINTTQMRDSRWEPSATVDIGVRYMFIDKSSYPVIETVEVDLEIDRYPDDTNPIERTITIPLV